MKTVVDVRGVVRGVGAVVVHVDGATVVVLCKNAMNIAGNFLHVPAYLFLVGVCLHSASRNTCMCWTVTQ